MRKQTVSINRFLLSDGLFCLLGSKLVVLSDLFCFKVEVEIVDKYVNKISSRNKVNIIIGDERRWENC